MTEYALAPNAKFTADSPYRTPRAMLEAGELAAYRVRGNGTMRHLELYPLGSTAREAAEWINDAIEMDGRSVQSVARELHISTPTVRRFLESLDLTEEIEAGEWDGLSFDSAGNPVWDNAWVESDAESEELAGDAPVTAPQPARRTAKVCAGGCGRNVTARNSAAKLRAAMGYDDMCAACYDQAGLENEHSDGHHADEPNADCPQCKDALLLARNQARFAPKTPQAAEAPGGQCEPEGTPADELEATLAASVAQAAPTMSRTLAVCFCTPGGGKQHAPGAEGCKNTAAPVRRVRSHG